MNFSRIESHFSTHRMLRYFAACGGKTRAAKLYSGNLKLARDFHPLLGILEVVLRNNVYDVVAAHYGDPDWIITQSLPGGFMSHVALKKHKYALRSQVERSIKKLHKCGTHPTGPAVVAEQTFGFWTDLFEPHHFGLLSKIPLLAFPHLPPGKTRHDVATALKTVRLFRNRINHNESIVFRGSVIDLQPALDVYNTMIDVFLWLDPALIKFIKPLDRVNRTINYCDRI